MNDMSPQAQPSTALVPVREYRVVEDRVSIFDTAKFEHMQRIATMMARTATIPESLRVTKVGDNTVDLPMETVQAHCFMIVNQAHRWGMDPFAVAQCTSIVRGRLMYEGKLVAAVIEAQLGVRLKYKFNDKIDRQMSVTVIGTLPGDTEPSEISGTVDDWHAGDKSPWARPVHWPRQMRYRGAREWGRAFAPAVLLGVYTDDDTFDDMVRPTKPARITPSTAKAEAPAALTAGVPSAITPVSDAGAPVDVSSVVSGPSEGEGDTVGTEAPAEAEASQETVAPQQEGRGAAPPVLDAEPALVVPNHLLDLQASLADCKTAVQLDKVWKDWRAFFNKQKAPDQAIMTEIYGTVFRRIKAADAARRAAL